MPGPNEEERRSTEFSPEREESHGRTVNKAVSSRRLDDPGKQQPGQGSSGRRRRRPRSGSDSNAGPGTRGH